MNVLGAKAPGPTPHTVASGLAGQGNAGARSISFFFFYVLGMIDTRGFLVGVIDANLCRGCRALHFLLVIVMTATGRGYKYRVTVAQHQTATFLSGWDVPVAHSTAAAEVATANIAAH